MRAPVLVPLPDDDGGISSIVTNLLYMYGVIATPDVHWVDRQLGRKPGHDVADTVMVDFLLTQGFRLHSIREKRFDDRHFLKKGLSYLREFHGAGWTQAYADFWTREMVVERQRLVARSLPLREARASQITIHYGKPPAVEDIRQQLELGRAVDLTLGNNAPYAALAARRDMRREGGRRDFLLYVPGWEGFHVHGFDQLFVDETGWDPRYGINAWWRP